MEGNYVYKTSISLAGGVKGEKNEAVERPQSAFEKHLFSMEHQEIQRGNEEDRYQEDANLKENENNEEGKESTYHYDEKVEGTEYSEGEKENRHFSDLEGNENIEEKEEGGWQSAGGLKGNKYHINTEFNIPALGSFLDDFDYVENVPLEYRQNSVVGCQINEGRCQNDRELSNKYLNSTEYSIRGAEGILHDFNDIENLPLEYRQSRETGGRMNGGRCQSVRELEVNKYHMNKEYKIPVAENCLDDFDDIENLTLACRENSVSGCRLNGKRAYISKNKKVLWDIQPILQTASRNINSFGILGPMGKVIGGAQEAETPLEAWGLFINDKMIQAITAYTNIWIDKQRHKYSRERDCNRTNPSEIKAVIGLLYLGGVMKCSHDRLKDIYASDGLGVDFFSLVMAKDRLQFLLRALRFDDPNTSAEREESDKMTEIRELFEQFVENCKNNYAVSECVVIDEMLEPFRGQCSFRVFMGNKPARFGVKFIAMTCARTLYTSNLEVYVKDQPKGPFKISNSPKVIVERMIQPISGSGRNIIIGNSFTSLTLCADLLQNHKLTLVGTMRKGMGEIPPYFLETKGRPVGSSVFGYKQGCTLVSYKENLNKNVILLSSIHDNTTISRDCITGKYNRTSKTFAQPEIVLFYDSSKRAVEHVENFKNTFSVARVTNRWPMRLFYSILDFAGINSFVVLKENLKDQSMIRKDFIKSLAKELCKEYMSARVNIRSTPTWAKKRTCELLGLKDKLNRPPAEEFTAGRCCYCDWKKNRKSQTRCDHCRQFICREHSAPRRCVICTQFAEAIVNMASVMDMGLKPDARPPPPEGLESGRCYCCDYKKNRKTKIRCKDCRRFVCREHAGPGRCVKCVQVDEEDDLETIYTEEIEPLLLRGNEFVARVPSFQSIDASLYRIRNKAQVNQNEPALKDDIVMLPAEKLRTGQGVTRIGSVKPLNHPLNAVEREATMVRCQIRERCLREPNRRPIDVYNEAVSGCSPEVRAYLSKYVDTIRREVQMARVQKGAEVGGTSKKTLKRKHSPSLEKSAEKAHCSPSNCHTTSLDEGMDVDTSGDSGDDDSSCDLAELVVERVPYEQLEEANVVSGRRLVDINHILGWRNCTPLELYPPQGSDVTMTSHFLDLVCLYGLESYPPQKNMDIVMHEWFN